VGYPDSWIEALALSTAVRRLRQATSPFWSGGRTRPDRSSKRRWTYSRADRHTWHRWHSSPIGLWLNLRNASDSSVPMRMATAWSGRTSEPAIMTVITSKDK